ncbi:60 kDa SS-A/Ro ribonucleoprotein-like [Pecten maximus]|uniref:60 kDa SS-A/Ro ribonucleoprotein-like n=1 Tax=Pecten maximus TaxID=6579 RepID=UPI00145854E1|nr:60 kDa SS-A/Ro ribonucleoprotein-like [Pecten maximus]
MASPEISNFDAFKRFLHLCTDGAVYKVIGNCCTVEKTQFLTELLSDHKGKEVLTEVLKCHTERNSVKKETLLFTVALCAKSTDKDLKQLAYQTFLKICKSPRELFQFLSYQKTLTENTRGWGRSLKHAVSQWYNQQVPLTLAESVTRQISYCGWTHRDVLRLGHIKGASDATCLIFKYLVKGIDEAKKEFDKDGASEEVKKVLDYLVTVDTIKHSTDDHQVACLVEKHKFGLESIPTKLLNSKEVWRALINVIPMTTLLQYFGKLAAVGLLETSCDTSKTLVEKLQDVAALEEGRVEPLSVLLASRIYEQGKGGKPKWSRNEGVVRALDIAFDSAIKKNMEATKKRYLVAVRVGVSKGKLAVRGTQVLSNIIAAAAMTSMTMKSEDKVDVVYFTRSVTPLPVSSESKLSDICDELATQIIIADNLPEPEEDKPKNDEPLFRGVPPPPCEMAAPIQWARENKKAVDVFLFLTDNRDKSTGKTSPQDALQQYRKDMDMPNTKMVTCGFTSATMWVADENDKRMLDIAGFDLTVPNVIRKFVMDTC